MSEALQKIEDFKRQLMDEMLGQCLPKQQEFFHKIFRNGVPDGKVEGAITLIERTLTKNIKEGRTK